MTTQTEVLKLALEALEEATQRFDVDTKIHRKAITAIKEVLAQEQPSTAVADGRLPEQEHNLNNIKFGGCPFCGSQSCVAGSCNQPKEPEQEPCPDKERDEYTCKDRHQCWEPCGELGKSEQHAVVAQPEQEPVWCIDKSTMELAESVGLIGPASRTHDLHQAIQRFHDLICANATVKAAQMAADAIRESASPQRKPLTDEQIEREWQFLHDEEGNPPDHHDFARAIEAAHGIKEIT